MSEKQTAFFFTLFPAEKLKKVIAENAETNILLPSSFSSLSPLSFFFGRFVVIVQSAGNQEGDEKSQKRLFQDLRDAGNSSNIRRILRASPFLASLG